LAAFFFPPDDATLPPSILENLWIFDEEQLLEADIK